MNDVVNCERLLTQATLKLQESLGHSVVLSAPIIIKSWSRSLVVRCQVKSAESHVSSVIIKQIKEDAARGFSDWASLAFLSALPEVKGLVPGFYAGDVSNRFFLMEDLGEGKNLQDLLVGSNLSMARAACRSLALKMAQLHGATVENQASFETIRAALPEADELGRGCEARQWLHNREKIFDWFKAVDYVPPSGFDSCLTHLAHVYDQADGFLGFTYGDPAPSNNLFASGQARLLDFEYGGFRHALYDITAWNINYSFEVPDGPAREGRRLFRKSPTSSRPGAAEIHRPASGALPTRARARDEQNLNLANCPCQDYFITSTFCK